MRPSSIACGRPPARVATTGVADASASSAKFGRPSTLPASSLHRRHGDDVGGGAQARDVVLRSVAEQEDAPAECRGAGRELVAQVAVAGDGDA